MRHVVSTGHVPVLLRALDSPHSATREQTLEVRWMR